MYRILFLMFFVISACSESVSKPQFNFKDPRGDGVVAQSGDIKITESEMVDGIESEIYEAEFKLYELKFNKVKSTLLERLITNDPRKKDLSNDDFLDKYVVSSVKISDSEINDFIKKQKIPSDHVNAQLKEKVKEYLSMDKKRELIDNWIGQQAKKPIEVFIKKPNRPKFNVHIGDAPFMGGNDAKVTIVEFSDFQCPYCANGAKVVQDLKKKYGNKIKVVFKNFPLPFHKDAHRAAEAALCANDQSSDSFWKLHDLMFENQDSLSEAGLSKLAAKAGLKSDAFEKCLSEKKYVNKVQQTIQEGKDVKVKSTPTFFVNGMLVNGAQPLEVFSDIIDQELAL